MEGLGLPPDRLKKLQQYETFLNDVLRAKLGVLYQQRNEILDEISQYLALEKSLRTIQQNKLTEMTTLVNLGHDFFVNAKVPDTSFVFVQLSMGFHVQMTIEEALDFIPQKTALLNEKTKSISDTISHTKMHIRLVLDGIKEVSGLAPPPIV